MKSTTKLLILSFLFFLQNIYAQNPKPKLVVGIVIDQMRYDYLYRYYDKYSNGGFKRLMNQGFLCRNTHYNYVPTATGPGHASIYTGTTPSYHGIVENDWYENGQDTYCALDTTVKVVGSITGYGTISPRNLLTTTFGDQLKIATANKSKVISVSIKDRGAALPAGHAGDAAYWYDGNSGKFVTSTYYMNQLPEWVEKFNQQKLADKYLSGTWETLLPIEQYTESQADENDYERLLPGKNKSTFPYDLKQMSKAMRQGQMKRSPYNLLSYTPFGNSIVKELALDALKNESLGQDNITDLLAISFSSTDIIGHNFGPQSVEVEDTYLRLDQELADLLNNLDQQVGFGEYVVFLTADHGAVQVPRYLEELKIPGGYLNMTGCLQSLETYLNTLYGQDFWVEKSNSSGVYLNHSLIIKNKLTLEEVQRAVADYLRDCEGIFETIIAIDLERQEYTRGMKYMYQNGYYHKRSPDVFVIHQSGWLEKSWNKGGTSHGSAYRYDTHIPLLWYGWGIKKGNTVRKVSITDIAPTISSLLNITFPSGASGQPILELFD